MGEALRARRFGPKGGLVLCPLRIKTHQPPGHLGCPIGTSALVTTVAGGSDRLVLPGVAFPFGAVVRETSRALLMALTLTNGAFCDVSNWGNWGKGDTIKRRRLRPWRPPEQARGPCGLQGRATSMETAGNVPDQPPHPPLAPSCSAGVFPLYPQSRGWRGQVPRQPGQVRKEAAVTSPTWVVVQPLTLFSLPRMPMTGAYALRGHRDIKGTVPSASSVRLRQACRGFCPWLKGCVS